MIKSLGTVVADEPGALSALGASPSGEFAEVNGALK
jgi:hypothetical protein